MQALLLKRLSFSSADPPSAFPLACDQHTAALRALIPSLPPRTHLRKENLPSVHIVVQESGDQGSTWAPRPKSKTNSSSGCLAPPPLHTTLLLPR